MATERDLWQLYPWLVTGVFTHMYYVHIHIIIRLKSARHLSVLLCNSPPSHSPTKPTELLHIYIYTEERFMLSTLCIKYLESVSLNFWFIQSSLFFLRGKRIESICNNAVIVPEHFEPRIVIPWVTLIRLVWHQCWNVISITPIAVFVML